MHSEWIGQADTVCALTELMKPWGHKDLEHSGVSVVGRNMQVFPEQIRPPSLGMGGSGRVYGEETCNLKPKDDYR